MRVYINKYRYHWLSPYTILKAVCFWEKNDDVFPNNRYDKWVNRLEPICVALQKFLNIIHPKIDYVKIDRWDTWSMDHTLSSIILPMLIQLQATKQGAPSVDDEDVPEELRSTAPGVKDKCKNEWDIDDNHFKRWDWVLNEEIVAFKSLVDDSWQEQFWTGEWGDTKFVESDFQYPNPVTGVMEKTHTMEHTGDRKCDYEGLKAYEARIDNGFRLFGKYFRAHWD